MTHDIHTHISDDALPALVQYCQERGDMPFTLIADDKTYAALGERAEAALKAGGVKLKTIVLTGEEVISDEHYIMDVFLHAPAGEQIFIAVGSGTITDITRYVAYRTANAFISVPTAPSVDGFISTGAVLVFGGMKDTVYVIPPLAVFADLPTLANAPPRLIAAGYGDILGKYTALADWKLAHLLWGESYQPAIADRVERALKLCVASTDAIAARSAQGIRHLIEALLQSGLGMVECGNSRPASGAEHHCSHYWEMKLLEDQQRALLHGAKVGYATGLIAQQYAALRALTRPQLLDLLERAEWPSRAEMTAEIRTAYPKTADAIIAIQKTWLELPAQAFDDAKRRILDQWDAVQDILATVPPPAEVKRLMGAVGGATTWQTLGLEKHRVLEALQVSHYLRERFTVFKLLKLLGMPTQSADEGLE